MRRSWTQIDATTTQINISDTCARSSSDNKQIMDISTTLYVQLGTKKHFAVRMC